MKDYMNKWNLTGLLNGLETSDKILVANCLEKCFQNIKQNSNKDKLLSLIIFPLIRRIFDEGNKLEAKYHKIKQLYMKKKKGIEKISLMIGKDFNQSEFELVITCGLSATYIYEENKTIK